MITCYFGLPGCGKSTMLAKIAYKELKRIRKGKSPYDRVLSNYYIDGCYKVTFEDMQKYNLSRSLILLDEITLDVDSRNFKSFNQQLKEFFILHRHEHIDIVYCSQQYDGVDKKVRDLTHELFYMKKIGNLTWARAIYRKITIPEDAEIKMGYVFPKIVQFITRPFTNLRFCWRPRYYHMFDSFEVLPKPKMEFIPWNSEPERIAPGAIATAINKIKTFFFRKKS